MRVVKNKFYDEYLETQSRNYNEKREKNLIDKYGEVDGITVFNGGVWIGMSYSMLIDALGYQLDKNSIKTESNIYETLYYNNDKIYHFENKILTAIQE